MVTLSRSDTGRLLIQLVLFALLSVLWLRSSQAEVEVGICRRHLNRVRLTSMLGGCGIVAGLGMIVAGVALGVEYGYLLLAGIVLFLSAPISVSLAGRFLTAMRIEPRLVWIRGVCPEYLSALPERGAGGTR